MESSYPNVKMNQHVMNSSVKAAEERELESGRRALNSADVSEKHENNIQESTPAKKDSDLSRVTPVAPEPGQTARSVAFAADSLYPIIHRPAFSHVRYLTQQPPTSHMWSHHMRPALTAPAHSLIRATTVSGVPVPIVRTNPAGFINPGLQEHISLEMKQGSLNPRESDTPSPQVLAQHHRMGSDDLLADEPMDRSYSDEEGKEKHAEDDNDTIALESQEEMENFSHGDDDDNASFASFLEHETAQPFHEEKKIVSSAPATPKNTPQYPNQDAGETKEKSMHALTNGKTKRTFSVQDYKNITKSPPREIKELLKTSGTKRAPLDLSEWTFPKKCKFSRVTAFVPRVPAPKGVNQSLQMMKLLLQPSFNKELYQLVNDYLQMFYQAAGNVQNNGSHDRIDESKVQEIVTGMLNEAWKSLHGESHELKLPKIPLVVASDGQTPLSKQKLVKEKEPRPPPHRTARRIAGERASSSRQVPDTSKWYPDDLNENTKFVLGVRANEAYGYAGYRGKIYYVHPNLFRYNTDNEDRKYLLEHRKLTLQGGRAFLVLYDQIVKIMNSNSHYSNNDTVVKEVKNLEVQAFTLPKFILKKVQETMKDLIAQHGRKNRPNLTKTDNSVPVESSVGEASADEHDIMSQAEQESVGFPNSEPETSSQVDEGEPDNLV